MRIQAEFYDFLFIWILISCVEDSAEYITSYIEYRQTVEGEDC